MTESGEKSKGGEGVIGAGVEGLERASSSLGGTPRWRCLPRTAINKAAVRRRFLPWGRLGVEGSRGRGRGWRPGVKGVKERKG